LISRTHRLASALVFLGFDRLDPRGIRTGHNDTSVYLPRTVAKSF